tara:strand:+ start:1037 stop:1675 length:639 start_codon:yes stop_codon:yes gene_type:complete
MANGAPPGYPDPKFQGYKNSNKLFSPEQPNAYMGRQIILNSDRLLFNAKEDCILMYSEKAIGLNTQGSVNIDTGENPEKNYFTVNSPNIFLGLQGQNNDEYPDQPAVLGFKMVEYMNDILDLIESLYMFLLVEYTVTAPDEAGETAPGENDITGEQKQIDLLRKKVNGEDGLNPYTSMAENKGEFLGKGRQKSAELKRFRGSGILSTRIKLT